MIRVIMLCLALTGCVTSPFGNLEHELNSRFEFIDDDERDLWCVLPLGKQVQGDCDDWAVTINHHTGADVFYVITEMNEPHLVACKDELCTDNLKVIFWRENSGYNFLGQIPQSRIDSKVAECAASK